MNAMMTTDAGALYGAKERAKPIAGGGTEYAEVLTLNANAQIALQRSLHQMLTPDHLPRPELEEGFKNSLNAIANAYLEHPDKYVSSHHAKPVHLQDALIDRVEPALPDTASVMQEVNRQLDRIPQNLNPEVGKGIGRNLIGLYAARIMEEAALIRTEDTRLLHDNGPVLELPIQIQQAYRILGEMQHYGIEDVRQFYSVAEAMTRVQTEAELHILHRRTEHTRLHPEVKRLLLALEAKERERLLQSVAEDIENGSRPPTKSETARNFLEDLRETYAYIDSLTPDEQKGFFAQLPLKTLVALHRTRTLMNMFTDRIATSSELREMFWQIRLGRKVGDFLKNHPLQYAKPADLNRYTEHVFDRTLSSEGAGFEITAKLPVEASGKDPDESITAMVQSLCAADSRNFPGNPKPVLITVVVNEFTALKLHIPPQASHDQIRDIVGQTKRARINLSPEARAQLTYTGYMPSKERWKDPIYRTLYGHGERLSVPGDYLVYVSTSEQPDRMDPLTLYHVGPHKAAVNLHIGQHPELGVIFNHRDFDGVPAKKTFQTLMDTYTQQIAAAPLGESANKYVSLKNVLHEDRNPTSFPIPEGVGAIVDNHPYQKMKLKGPDGETITLTPTDVRSITVGLANDVDYMLHLYAGSLPPEYAKAHPTHNNVQPNVIGFELLRRALASKDFPVHELSPSLRTQLKKLFGRTTDEGKGSLGTWADRFTESSLRCKKGEGPASTMSAVVGTWEGPLGTVAAMMHPGTVMLTDSDGMFSSVFDPQGKGETATFTTAQSDAYSQSSGINLMAPRASAGAVGYNQEGKNGTAVTTCRKFPGQAQVEFRNAVTGWFSAEENSRGHADRALEYMTELIRDWDRLVHGKTTLSSYLSTRDAIYGHLQDGPVCGRERLEKLGVTSAATLQVYLNKTLRNAAQETLNRDRLHAAYEAFTKAVSGTGDNQ